MHEDDFELSKNNMLRPIFANGILGKMVLYLSLRLIKKEKAEPFHPARFVKHLDDLHDLGINAKIIGLPGHTKGSIGVLVDDSELIVGDALVNICQKPHKTRE